MQPGKGWGEALQQQTPQVVESFGVFLHAPQPALGLVPGSQVFGVAHTQGEQPALGVGKRAHGFNDLFVLVADALEVERAAFGRDQQLGNAVGGLGGGKVNH